METEVYSCGCNLRYQKVDTSEFPGEPPSVVLVPSLNPCSKHKQTRVVPPPGERLITVLGEHEKFLNE